MVIDKKLNLDREYEYFPDGGLAFAQNIVLSQDGLCIENEPAIEDFLKFEDFQLVGFVACNEEFVLFGKNVAGESIIYRCDKNKNFIKLNTNWQHEGGDVFGAFTYNVNDELIVAISERNLPEGVDCPVKVINLDRDEKIEGVDDNIYTLTPEIPRANIIKVEYILGNRIKKGKYNFFIKYYIGDNFETAWFPIGSPVYVYDNISSSEIKTIDKEQIQAVKDLNDRGLPKRMYNYNIIYEDFYNEDDDYTNNNVRLTFEINNIIKYTHYRIGYIINSKAGMEGRQGVKQKTENDNNVFKVLIDEYSEPVSVDDLTVGAFNIYNVNTMCNYKDRLYLANYKEENRNKDIENIDTSQIRIYYKTNDIDLPSIQDSDSENFDNYNALRNQWISKPGRCAVYNFYIHYVYPNGNYTDGIKIGSKTATYADLPITNELVELETITNSKGDLLYKTPDTKDFNAKKLYFQGIRMYPQFVGYFISYEKPEYIQIGEGFLVAAKAAGRNATDGTLDFFTSRANISSKNWKFYYPEFSIVGGKTNAKYIIPTGHHIEGLAQVNVATSSRGNEAKGYTLFKNSFHTISDVAIYPIENSAIKSPNGYENIGNEGYLRLDVPYEITVHQTPGTDADGNGLNFKSYTAVTTLADDNIDLYLSDTKKLVSLGYTKFVNYTNDNYDNTYGDEDVPYNYDFYRCFSSIIFFKSSGIIINQTESNHINVNSGEPYYPDTAPKGAFYPHIGIIKYWHETHYPLFLKEINQAPETIFYSYYKYEEGADGAESYKDATQYQRKSLVLSPQYVNDLYKLPNAYYDYTGKLFVNYDEKLISNQMEYYNKTVRRSDVIQSESIKNSWRFFRPENYKVITEDKGAINNVVGIGNYLFVHCEHSLFLFDITDTIQTIDKNIQLLQPDSFEVAYKEVFTADKGFGGIQDHVSWICDEFGYIFYDKSSKKIYRYDGGKLLDATDGVSRLIKHLNPEYIYMGNDRKHNRIMFNLVNKDSYINSVILSYSTIFNAWLSTHSYVIDGKFIGLKDDLYLLHNQFRTITDPMRREYTALIRNWATGTYNDYHYLGINFTRKISTHIAASFVDVVFTGVNYNKIKVLDFITYILNKEPEDVFDTLRIDIFTNCCYSGPIDIREERKKVSEYKKPYYDYERWNFNYFRNRIDKIENGNIIVRPTGFVKELEEKVQRGYDNALITGKYVIIRFIFKNLTKKVSLKDIHAYFKP